MKILFFFLAILSFVVFADSSLYGPSGLVTMPTAQSLHYKELTVSYDYLFNVDNSDQHSWVYSLNLGTFENLEVGVVGGERPEEGLFLNVKYFITEGSERLPLTFAAGFENLSSNDESAFYLVVSKTLQPDFHIHGGFKAIFSDELDPMIMVGTNYFFNEKIEFLGDINGQNQSYFVNLGAKYQLNDNVVLRASIVDLFHISPRGRFFSFGIVSNRFF